MIDYGGCFGGTTIYGNNHIPSTTKELLEQKKHTPQKIKYHNTPKMIRFCHFFFEQNKWTFWLQIFGVILGVSLSRWNFRGGEPKKMYGIEQTSQKGKM